MDHLCSIQLSSFQQRLPKQGASNMQVSCGCGSNKSKWSPGKNISRALPCSKMWFDPGKVGFLLGFHTQLVESVLRSPGGCEGAPSVRRGAVQQIPLAPVSGPPTRKCRRNLTFGTKGSNLKGKRCKPGPIPLLRQVLC